MSSLQEQLGYQVKSANAARKVVRKAASSKAGSAAIRRWSYKADRYIFKRTGGKASLTAWLSGLPMLMLTTTGAKSKQKRTSPLAAIPYEGDLAIIGSNFGSTHTPNWVYNLEADPNCEVAVGANSASVVAHRLSGDAVENVFSVASGLYPGFAHYRDRASHREIRVFILKTQ